MTPVIGRGRTLFVDIDKTLISPYASPYDAVGDGGTFGDPEVEINGIQYKRLEANIYLVHRFAASDGVEIIFWSAGGALWAKQVTTALGIDGLAAAFLSKPSWYLDDVQDVGFAGHADKWIDATKVGSGQK